jgi:hypothetical protein
MASETRKDPERSRLNLRSNEYEKNRSGRKKGP